MAWQSESLSKRVGTIDSDSAIGGGSQNFSGDAETLQIRAQSETWFMGVQNEATVGNSDFFIGLDENEVTDNKFHIQNDGKIGIGTSAPSQELDVSGTINCTGLIVNGTNFSGLSSSSVWTSAGSNISYTAGTVTVGDGSSNKRDFKIFANATGNHVLLDASADTLTSTNVSNVITGGNLTVSYSSGGGAVEFDGQNSNSDLKWDSTGAWNTDTGLANTANNSPSLFLGDDTSTANKGVDFAVMGDTSGKYMWWDASADQLNILGTIDITGTANLDAVDIDGAVQIDGTVSVGVDGTGKDVTFFGDTADRKMLWDESEDKLYVYSASSAYTWLNGNDIHFDGAGFNTIDASTQLQFDIDANLKALLSSGGLLVVSPFTVGTTTEGYDVNIYGTDSGKIFWDQSTPELEITKALVDMNLADHAFDLDTTSGSISMSTTTGGMTLETTDNSALTINSASTSSSAAIDINATAGGIDVDAANTIAIDTSSGTIDIGTAATTAISIGNTTSEVTVNDNLKVNGSLSVAQFAEATTDDGTTAISAANIARKIIKCTPSADRSKATDTASNIISTCALTSDNDSIDFSIINLATDGTSFITVTAGSGVTLVGSMIVSAQDSAEDAFTSGVVMFRARRTGSSAITLYRIG